MRKFRYFVPSIVMLVCIALMRLLKIDAAVSGLVLGWIGGALGSAVVTGIGSEELHDPR